MILSFVFVEYGCGLLSTGKQSIRKLCRTSGHPPLQKARTFWAGTPPPPFQYTVPSHIKVAWLIRGQGGSYAVRGSPLRPFSRVLLCPRNIPKLRSCMGLVVVWIWASLIIAFLFLGSMGVACRVWASNQSTNFAACPATCCYKKPELLGWDPPRPPRVSITDFNIICGAISHKKCCGSFGGQGVSEAKSPAFCNGRHYGKESPDSISKAFTHACGVGI